MKDYIIISLVVGLLLVSIFCLYRFCLERGAVGQEDIQPVSNSLMIWLALVIALIVVLSFALLYGSPLNINNNIGQIGDFIGGLINPSLSFLALLVLLRTTQIQTAEARKTTKFMASQQKILELEKFEATFFQLVDRLDGYCEVHFRGEEASKNDTLAVTLADLLIENRKKFDTLKKFSQYRASRKHVLKVLDNDVCSTFYLRALRVLNQVVNSSLSVSLKRSYLGILRDTMLPDERIIFANLAFCRSRSARSKIRLWNLDFVREECYACKIISDYYHYSPKRAWHAGEK